jgi:integrase
VQAFIQRHCLQLIHHSRSRLHHAMPVPQQLPQIAILPARYPDLWKIILQQKFENVPTRFGFHNLRHGLATWLAEQGTDPAVIQRMLRHSSKDMTMHYIHAKAREAQEQYIAELGIVPDEPSGSAVRVQ